MYPQDQLNADSPRQQSPYTIQAGLLTSGLSYSLRLPDRIAKKNVSGMIQVMIPVTAAGPSSIFTRFPFQSFYRHLNKKRIS